MEPLLDTVVKKWVNQKYYRRKCAKYQLLFAEKWFFQNWMEKILK